LSVRTPEFSRNLLLEELLNRLNNELFRPVDDNYGTGRSFAHPLVFVVGCPRSGSTFLLQWLLSSGIVVCPDNFLSRFYKAPYLGQLIKDMLFDPQYTFRDELADIACANPVFSSKLGKTSGSASVNEFHYFWRNFISDTCSYPDSEEMRRFRLPQARFELERLIAYLQAPFACKGLLFNDVLSHLACLFPEALFINLQRDPFFNAQSLLLAREAFWGERNSWYSFDIPEKKLLAGENAVHQVAGQVHYTRAAVQRELSQIARDRQITISYEALCESPGVIWDDIMQLLSVSTSFSATPYSGPVSFANSNHIRLAAEEQEELSACLTKFASTPLQYENQLENGHAATEIKA